MLATTLVVALLAPQQPDPRAALPGVLTEDNLAAWQEHITPRPAEVAWEKIPWRATFAEGLADARAQNRPLLFWGMNGHPLGCT